MWTDRLTVYYSKEKSYAVRWLKHGHPEDEAEYRKFDDKVDAERFYNRMVRDEGDHPVHRVELFTSQAKWLCYHSNHDEFGDPKQGVVGESSLCLGGDHVDCVGPLADACSCPCHLNGNADVNNG